MRRIHMNQTPILTLFGSAFLSLGIGNAIFAEDIPSTVHTVLQKEAANQEIDRSAELKSLLHDNAKEARWQAGQVQVNGKWTGVRELKENSASESMREYRKKRSDSVLDVDGHRKLAKWCQVHSLDAQSSAHWQAVLDQNEEDIEAHTALGNEKIGNRWYSKQEIERGKTLAKNRVAQFKTWMPRMKQFAAAINGNDSRKKSKALAALRAIQDDSAIQSLLATALQLDGDYARPFVSAIRRQKSSEACMALAQFAIAHPNTPGAEEAISGLREYRQEFYVPELLSLVSDDTEIQQRIVQSARGELALEQVVMRETTQEKSIDRIRKLISLDSSRPNSSLSLPTLGNESRMTMLFSLMAPESQTAKEIGLREAGREQSKTQELVRQENLRKEQIRQNVIHVLEMTTQASPGNTAQQWWAWWEQQCDDNRISSKRYRANEETLTDRLVYDRQNVLYNEAVRESLGGAPRRVSILRDERVECLVAGTMIQTSSGLQPIESLRVGDLVLANDVESGKLDFKPILKTTNRPPATTLLIVTERETIQATCGHYWWVAGQGWLRTKELEPGMRLRNATSTTLIKEIQESPEPVSTYNLVIDDFHSYFVGEGRILSNDATELRPSLLQVPGLARSTTLENTFSKN